MPASGTRHMPNDARSRPSRHARTPSGHLARHTPSGAGRVHRTGKTRLLSISSAILAVALVGVTVAVFLPVTRSGFVSFDDYSYVVENPHVQRGFTADSLRWAFTSSYQAVWQPVVWLSYMLDFTLHGLEPGGYHLTNLILHGLNVVLLFAFLVIATGHVWRSATVALLFGVHPLHVESVAWIAERKDVLSTVFWFLLLVAYVRYATRPSGSRACLVAVALGFGLMAKPMLVTVPLLLLLLDDWPLGRQGLASRLVLEKLPLFALAGASALVTLWAQTSGQALRGFDEIPFWARLANAVISYTRYLEQTVWPSGLAVFYPHPGASVSLVHAAASTAVLAGVTFFAIRSRARHPYLAVGWLWYCVTLLPVSGLIQTGAHAMADRFTYVPLVGIFIAAVWGIAELASRLENRRRWLVAVPACAVLILLCVLARAQVGYWKDSIRLFERALAVTERNGVAHDMLGASFLRLGRTGEAIPHFLAALAIHPNRATAHYNLGAAYLSSGQVDPAIASLREAIRIRPDYGKAHGNLGIALFFKGQYVEAWRHVRVALDEGTTLPADFLKALRERMPEPR